MSQKGHKKRVTLQKRNSRYGLLFMAPWLIGLLLFTAMPFFYSLWLSICRVSFSTSGIRTEVIGIKWYLEAFQNDANFIPKLLSTLKFIVFLTPMIIVVSVIFALLLNKGMRGRGFFRALFFLPVVFINGPVMNKLIGNDATAIIKPELYGFYQIIETLPGVISVPLLYILDNIVLILWFAGIQILIALSALQKVNPSLYEAASIDGASTWQSFWKITMPNLKPMLMVSAVYTVVDLSCYGGNAINGYIKNNMEVTTKIYSYSAAMSWIYAVIVLLCILVVFAIFKERRKER